MPDKVQAETDKTVDVPKEAVREPADTPESEMTEGVQDSLPGLEPGERPKARRPDGWGAKAKRARARAGKCGAAVGSTLPS